MRDGVSLAGHKPRISPDFSTEKNSTNFFSVFFFLILNNQELLLYLCVQMDAWDKMAAIVPDDIFQSMFFNEDDCILFQISVMLVPDGLINKNLVLVQIMAWHQSGAKPLNLDSNLPTPNYQYHGRWWCIDLLWARRLGRGSGRVNGILLKQRMSTVIKSRSIY